MTAKLHPEYGPINMSITVPNFVWQDREIRFDVAEKQLNERPGEKALSLIVDVEDTKGNSGEVGILKISNLRLIYYTKENPKINLSVGFDCIISAEVEETNSAVKGNTISLFLRTRFN